jgi:molybdenum cofactor cytidylyltransferase
MGAPKQLLDFGGRPLVRHCVETALGSVCRPVVLVVGAHSEEVSAAVAGLPVRVVRNHLWSEGMGSSIRTGVESVTAVNDVEGLILTLADQPMLTPATFEALIDGHRRTGMPIVASSYSGTVGVPVFFARQYFDDLMQLGPSQGCKGLIMRHSDQAFFFTCPEAEFDIDTPEEYVALRPASQ